MGEKQMASMLAQAGTGWSRFGESDSKPPEPVHIWTGGAGNVLCMTAHPMIVVRFDCISQFSRESLCEQCVAAWQ